ncbi:hypothetical protein [Roseovarius confluentis]|uniref:hypothetical protein n=1 Tax=Roseovarius confluentis TaxID=1852027 RepID=UPI000CDD6058|nr:hypothetical protein [Roseovarius confluentis]
MFVKAGRAAQRSPWTHDGFHRRTKSAGPATALQIDLGQETINSVCNAQHVRHTSLYFHNTEYISIKWNFVVVSMEDWMTREMAVAVRVGGDLDGNHRARPARAICRAGNDA